MTAFTSITTQDGSVLVRDPRTGLTASGRSLFQAMTELRRLIALRSGNYGAIAR